MEILARIGEPDMRMVGVVETQIRKADHIWRIVTFWVTLCSTNEKMPDVRALEVSQSMRNTCMYSAYITVHNCLNEL